MKNFNIYFLAIFVNLLIVFFSYSGIANTRDIKIHTLSTNFNGSAFNEHSIVCYGSNGVILFSFDKGETWNQTNIPRKFNILNMISYGDYYFGHSLDGFIWTTDPELKEWKHKESPDFILEEFYSDIENIAIVANTIFILTKEKIFISDLDFNIDKSPIFEVIEDYTLLNLIKIEDKLAVITSMDELLLYDLMTKTWETKEIDFIKECSICRITNQIHYQNDKIYLNFTYRAINSTPYTIVSSDFGTSWFQYGDSIDDFMVNFKQNIIYKDSLTLSIRVNRSSRTPNDFDTLGLRMYGRSEALEFIVKYPIKESESFYPNSFYWKYRQPIFEYFAPLFKPDYSMTQIDSNILLICGKDKSIIMSFDFGRTWELKSILPNSNNFYSIFSNEINNELYLQTQESRYVSKDKGISWQPLEFYHTDLRVGPIGMGISNFLQNANSDAFILMENSENEKLIWRIDNSTNSYYYELFDTIIGNFTPLYLNSSKTLAFASIVEQLNERRLIRNHFFEFDSNFNVVSKSYIDSIRVDLFINNNPDSIFAIVRNQKEPFLGGGRINFANENRDVWLSTDFGENWEIVAKNIPRYLGASGYFYNNYLIYGYHTVENRGIIFIDLRNGNIDSIGTNGGPIHSSSMINYGNYLLNFAGGNNIYYHHLYDQINEWDSLNLRDIYENFDIVKRIAQVINFNDELYLLCTHPQFEIYKLEIDQFSSVENSETETPRSRAFLHAGKPYPLPAVSTVSADLHWNAQYSAQEAVLKVFDSMGNEIPNANVELQQTNPYSGTVTWDCGTYPTGVYFIQVTIGTEQKNVGVAVVR